MMGLRSMSYTIKVVGDVFMNKKLVGLVVSVATLANGVASAVDFDPKFYVGGEVQVGQKKGPKKITTRLGKAKDKLEITGEAKNGSSVSPVKKAASGASVFMGSRLTDNMGLELGGSMLKNQKFKPIKGLDKSSEMTIKNRNVYVDAMGYLPLDCSVDLIASVGAGHLSTKVNGKTVAKPTAAEKFSAKSSKMGVRVGMGAQYKFNENLGARLMVRHQQGNKIVKRVNSAGLGMFYQF